MDYQIYLFSIAQHEDTCLRGWSWLYQCSIRGEAVLFTYISVLKIKKPKSFTLLLREETVLCVCVFCTTWHEELLQNWNSCYNKVLEIYEVLQEGGDCSPPDKSNLKPVKPEDMMVVSQHSISDCTQTVQ